MTIGYPDGIGDVHAREPPFLHRHASPLSILLLGALLLIAAQGWFGGEGGAQTQISNGHVTLRVTTPPVLRNGEFFESWIRITPHRRLRNAVVAVSPGLWRDITVNTVIPQAADEHYEDGFYRLAYGALEPGDELLVKLDSQINPTLFGGIEGEIAVFDQQTKLASLPLAVKVRP